MKRLIESLYLKVSGLFSSSILFLAEYSGNYTSEDMDDIAVDLAGNAGVELKTYMSLIILAFVGLILSGVLKRIITYFD